MTTTPGILLAAIVMTTTIAGCDSSANTSSETTKPATTGQFVSPGSRVMTEQHRQAVTDQMVKQGADRTDAEAFTKALNEAQSEWESER